MRNKALIKALLLHAVTVPIMFTIKMTATLLGFVVVPIALRGAKTVPSSQIRGDYAYTTDYVEENQLLWQERHLPKWAWLWDNYKDGTLGDKRGWWRYERCNGNPGTFWNQFLWLAFRNPANNLRHTRLFYYVPRGLKYYVGDYRVDDEIGRAGWHFVWTDDNRTGFYGIWQYGKFARSLEIRTGWKLRPGPQGDNVGFTVLIHPFRRL